jgi:hypothetical protein
MRAGDALLQTQASDVVCMGDDVHRNSSACHDMSVAGGMAMAWTATVPLPLEAHESCAEHEDSR